MGVAQAMSKKYLEAGEYYDKICSTEVGGHHQD